MEFLLKGSVKSTQRYANKSRVQRCVLIRLPFGEES